MINNQSEKTSYNWLVIFIILSTFALFSAGFDNDVVYYGVMLMAASVSAWLLFYKDTMEINKVVISFLFFTLWAFASVFWSISPIRTVIEGIQLIAFLLIYIITRKLSKEGLDKLFIVLFLVSGGIALLGILEYLFVSGCRILATFTNPNPFGIYMVMMFLVALSLSIHKKEKTYFVLSVLFLSVVLLSGSRASMGALAFSLVFVFFGLDRSQIKAALIKSVLIFIIAFVFSQVSIYASIYIRENIFLDQSLLDSITRSSSFITSSLKGRLEFWRVAFDLFKNQPILGYGNGTYFSAYYIEYGMNEWYSRFTHNHYLQIMSELGIVGITLFLGFLWTGFKSVIYNSKQTNKPIYFWGMVAGLVAFLLHIGVDFTWNFPAVTALFFFFLGITTKEDKKPPLKLSRTISLVGLLLIILITGWQLGSTKLYMRALNLEQEESYESALSLTQKVNRVYPISSFGWSYESDLLHRRYLERNNQEDLDEAFLAAEKARRRSPYNANINIKLARLYFNNSDFNSAEKYYIAATRYSAYVLSSFSELGNIYIERGQNDKAIEIFLSALDRAPHAIKSASKELKEETVDSVANMYLALGSLYNEAGEIDKMKEQINQVVELKKEYPFLEKYFK